MKLKSGSIKKVYVAIIGDGIHPGHLNIINIAKEYGDVYIGLLTDEAVATYRRLPVLSYEHRKTIIENIVGVKEVIPQNTREYDDNILKLKPDYVVHGDDWREGIQKHIRERVIQLLSKWDGELIEPSYTQGLSSSSINASLQKNGTTSELRLKSLRRLLQHKPLVRILEAHSGLTGLIVENISITHDGQLKEFDGMWLSSLTDSTAKGKPDIEVVDLTSRLHTVQDILEITTKPIIFDGDTGGPSEHFTFMVKTLERLGVSAVIIEDKVGLKKNSLFGTDIEQTQDSIENFSSKISSGKKVQVTDDFMIMARVESLILKAGLNDALKRSEAYIKAGADAIMIHSKEKSADEIIDFCKEYSKFDLKVPLVVVPSTYSHITESELSKMGVGIVIYANHLLRSAYPTMLNTAESILKNERALEADEQCMPIKDIINLIPGAN
ncbi:phosphoenolpyruvate mutase [Candidatus Marinimicrobia bacterium MT.SAG.4]|nr:phosphoenolpyruvate mutase [Candidatus Marinimicrobia bacterium MT.SAG.4]